MDRTREELEAEIKRLREIEERFKAMLPLFQEARDALTAISWSAAKMHNLDLTLAERMDEVGIADRWQKRQAALKGAKP